jgi:hypothetical protein
MVNKKLFCIIAMWLQAVCNKLITNQRKIMKKIFFAFLTLTLTTLSLNSCKETSEIPLQEENQAIKTQKNDITARTVTMQKSDFNDLSTNDKIKIWSEKLDQVLTQNLTDEQRTLVQGIKIELPNVASDDYDGIRLAELGLEMAKITPEDEYIRMFEMLDDYHRDNSLYTNNIDNANIVDDMNIFLQEVKDNKDLYQHETLSKGSCNCKWTCGFYSGHTDNCIKTDSGCGFLWMSSCNGAII